MFSHRFKLIFQFLPYLYIQINMILFAAVCICFLVTITRTQDASTPFAIVASTQNGNDRWIEIANSYRAQAPSIKFGLRGTLIDSVTHLNNTSTWSINLGDKSKMDLVVNKSNKFNITEYQFNWHGNGSSLNREVCFHYGHNNASWYYTYESNYPDWPMNRSKTVYKQEFNFPLFRKLESFNIVEHLFVSSDGFALMLDQHEPLFMHRDPNKGDAVMCLSVEPHTLPYMTIDDTPTHKDIKFSIYTASNIRTVYENFAINLGNIAKPSTIPDEKYFTNPIWTTWLHTEELNQSNIIEFARDISANKFASSGLDLHVLWENKTGDLEFHKDRFPDPKLMIGELHRLSHRIMLWIHSSIDHQSKVYKQSAQYLIYNTTTVEQVDFTNAQAVKWFSDRLVKLRSDYQIDIFNSFIYDIQRTRFVTHDNYTQIRDDPSLFAKQYAETMAKFGTSTLLDVGYKTQHLPNFLKLLSKSSNWGPYNGLKSLIPTMLSLSIGGYSFVIPENIRGKTEELYIRWLQATTFMPAMQFSVPPWQIHSNITVSIAHKFVSLHAEHAPTIIGLAKRRVTDGTPMIRPMWYAAPDDTRAHAVDDQFMLGDDIVVAPVVIERQRERQVFLPPGKWIDQHGQSYDGSAVVKVTAPLEELPYFKKKS